MTVILLIFAALIVVLQIGLTLTLRRLLDLLAGTRDQVDALQRRVHALEQERDARVPPPSALFTLAPRSEPAAPPEPVAPTPADLPVLQEPAQMPPEQPVEVRVRELARQGLSVRDIAERCGLSEAEAELMIRLRQEPF